MSNLSRPRTFSAKHDSNKGHFKHRSRFQRTFTEQSDHNTKAHRMSSNILQVQQRGFKHQTAKSFKAAQQVHQQNLSLKKCINELQNQLCVQRSKIEVQKKKTAQYSRIFSREFQKQMYYSGKHPHAHMISGVKHQYSEIKRMYQEKCLECDQLRKMVELTDMQQLQVYCEMLENENKELVEKLKVFRRVTKGGIGRMMSSKQSGGYKSSNKSKKQIENDYLDENIQLDFVGEPERVRVDYLLAQECANNEKSKEIIQGYCDKLKKVEKILKDKSEKIEFLEKILIDKDNLSYNACQKAKRVQRQKNQAFEKGFRLEREIIQLKQNYEAEIERLKDKQQRRSQLQKQLFEKSMLEKNTHIEKLEKEIRFLSTLLSYWKPVDEVGERGKNQKQSDSRSEQSEGMDRSGQLPSKTSQAQPKDTEVSLEVPKPIDNQRMKASSKSKNREDELIRQTRSGVNELRVPRTADAKHSEKAVKCRKVQVNEIAAIGDLLKYRFIGYHKSIDEVRQLFNSVGNEADAGSRESSEYISMREVIGVLKEHPFLLKEESAFLLARYIVEDCSNEHVYCDQSNEVKRSIAKSIIKAFVAEYEVGRSEQRMEQWHQICKTYSANLRMALNSIAPKGLITMNKYVQLIGGLGIDISPQTIDWCIGEMIKQSQSLNELKYDVLFRNS